MTDVSFIKTSPKYLVIRQSHKRTKAIWDTLRETLALELRVIPSKNYDELCRTFAELHAHDYDRVVFDCNIRNIGQYYRVLRRVPRLVIYDNDLYHHFHPCSAYFGLFVSLFKTLEPHHVIATGLEPARRLAQEGLNVCYLPKSYDPGLIQNLDRPRDIELAFVGRTKNKIYRERKRFLEALRARMPVEILRTTEDDSYNLTLNRIRFFLSADHGLHEYMAKNFEAMAAGCVLLTLPTSDAEAEQLGFVDMKTVVFYRDIDELCEKLARLRANPELADRIAQQGRLLAESRHQDQHRAEEMKRLLQLPLSSPPPVTFRDRWNLFRLRCYHVFNGE